MGIKKISLLTLLGSSILVNQAIAMDSAVDKKEGKEDSSHYMTRRSPGVGAVVTPKENGQEGRTSTGSLPKNISFESLNTALEGLSDELLLFMINYQLQPAKAGGLK